ncbi:MAG: pyruvate kinase [Comamonadaceae bacterium]|nr:pyruvate kinase [Comamonadaceae bacterium]
MMRCSCRPARATGWRCRTAAASFDSSRWASATGRDCARWGSSASTWSRTRPAGWSAAIWWSPAAASARCRKWCRRCCCGPAICCNSRRPARWASRRNAILPAGCCSRRAFPAAWPRPSARCVRASGCGSTTARSAASCARRPRTAITVEITQARSTGAKLRPEKGINFPDTELPVPALTADDRSHLEAMAPHVDIVGLSFVRRPQDVLALQESLRQLDAGHVGTVLKIETRQAFENLPRLLLAAMRNPPVGVMVARGDLGRRGRLRAPGGTAGGDPVAVRKRRTCR